MTRVLFSCWVILLTSSTLAHDVNYSVPKTFNQNYNEFEERLDHSLVGSNTPVFISRIRKNSENQINVTILYEAVNNSFSESKLRGLEEHNIQEEKSISEKNKRKIDISNPVVKKFGNVTYQSWYESCNTDPSDLNFIYNNSNQRKTCGLENVSKGNDKEKILKVYPQILVIVDHETALVHKKNPRSIATYVAAFFNGVDLRFRKMKNPAIRLNIAGIIIPESSEVEPYFKFKCYSARDNLMFAHLALSETRNYFKERSPFEWCNYDIIFTMTHRDLMRTYPLEGISLPGDCNNNDENHIVPSVMVQDMGAFDGIITAVHELAHLFGANHESSQQEESCRDQAGYIERKNSIRANSTKAWQFSPCTRKSMQDFLKTSSASCYWNKPDVGEPYIKVLPGRLIDRDEQCQLALGMSKATQKTNCIELWCENLNVNETKSTYDPPAEGTSCGQHSICLDGECVPDPLHEVRRS